jgi:hypothetical protein
MNSTDILTEFDRLAHRFEFPGFNNQNYNFVAALPGDTDAQVMFDLTTQ